MANQLPKQRKDMTSEELEAHVLAIKARQRAYQREWRKKNAVRYYAKQRERRKNNPKHAEWSRQWTEKNRTRINANARVWARKNKAKNKVRFLRYLNGVRAQRYEEWAYKQAVKRGCVIADRDKLVEMYQRAIDMTKQSGIRWSVDHIISMSFQGAHRPENCQPMPVSLNASKSANPFWVCEDGRFKDWRNVPMAFWPEKFKFLYNGVLRHASEMVLSTRTA